MRNRAIMKAKLQSLRSAKVVEDEAAQSLFRRRSISKKTLGLRNMFRVYEKFPVRDMWRRQGVFQKWTTN